MGAPRRKIHIGSFKQKIKSTDKKVHYKQSSEIFVFEGGVVRVFVNKVNTQILPAIRILIGLELGLGCMYMCILVVVFVVVSFNHLFINVSLDFGLDS